MADARISKLITAFIAALTTSGVIAAMLIAGWTIYGLIGGGFRNLNDIIAMFSYAMTLFVICTAVLTAYFALTRK
ncbi:MAG: hypothetical protein ABL871_16445 [Terricaulis sp.]